MSPDPVTVRLLDPPMHEFLPTEHQLLDDIKTLRLYRDIVRGRQTALASIAAAPELPETFSELSEELVNDALTKKERMLQKVGELQETNPMLGHRGVRLGITYPEIYAMQIQAILEAAAECTKKGIQVQPEIMVPQVITSQELAHVKRTVDHLKNKLEKETGEALHFKFGQSEPARGHGIWRQMSSSFLSALTILHKRSSRFRVKTRKINSCRCTTSQEFCRTIRSRFWTYRASAS